jgi:hypothetical protein
LVYFVETEVCANRERKRCASKNKPIVAMAKKLVNPHSVDPLPLSGSNPKMRSIQSGIVRVIMSATALTTPRAVSIHKRSDG